MPLHKMLQAVHLMTSSKKGISAHQLRRVLEVQYKSAWFLAQRIREAVRSGDLARALGWDDDPERFRKSEAKLVKHKPVENPD